MAGIFLHDPADADDFGDEGAAAVGQVEFFAAAFVRADFNFDQFIRLADLAELG